MGVGRNYDAVYGMALAHETQWDEIVLDRMLPGELDGLDILSAMRTRGEAMRRRSQCARQLERVLARATAVVMPFPTSR